MSSPKNRTQGMKDPEIVKYPKLDEKKVVATSGMTTLRFREPTNEFMAGKVPHMIWDFRSQHPVVPARVATGANGPGVTTNRSGRPYALDTFVGGSPDPEGSPLAMPIKQKMTE